MRQNDVYFMLVIAVNMMQASTLTSGTWSAGSSKFGGRGLHARFARVRAGAFADAPSAAPSRPVHARVQHL